MREWAIPATDILSRDEQCAARALQDGLNFNVFAQPLFWEHVVATHFGGETTKHGELHDIEVIIGRKACKAEVKFSRSFKCNFAEIRGKDWSRHVFKWAKPRGLSGKQSADAIVLIGLEEGLLFSWLVPTREISATCASITMTTPMARTGSQSSKWDRFAVPFDALLPAFAAICHNRYDAPMRRAGIRERAFSDQITIPFKEIATTGGHNAD